MPDEILSRRALGRAVSADELMALLRDGDEHTLLALLKDPRVEEPHICQMLERLDLSATVLTAVATEGKWTSREEIRLRLARHPHTPRRFSIAVLRHLYLFDLVRLSLLPSTPAEIRRVADEIIITRVPQMPVGHKLTLARRGSARVAGALLAEGHSQGVKLALANASLTESQVLKVLAKPEVPDRVVAAIARDPKWSCKYNVRVALVRNVHTPAPVVRAILPNLTLRDLKDVLTLEAPAPHLRKYISQELARRSGSEPRSGR